MRTSWCLPPLAALFLGGALWITFRGPRVDPAALLDSARRRLANLPEAPLELEKQRAEARRELDLGLRRATSAEDSAVRAELLGLRAELSEEEGRYALALEDSRARLALGARDADTLARACALFLRQGLAAEVLPLAGELVALDPARGHAYLGSAHLDLAEAPLAAIERLAQGSLAPTQAELARTLARRAAALAGEDALVLPAREELLELFTRPDERRRAGEWLREAVGELGAARASFLDGLGHGATSLGIGGLQELCLRAGLEEEAAELGLLALSQPELAEPMRLLARTAQTLVDLGREGTALGLVRAVQRRLKGRLTPEDLPSDATRDELGSWCELLERLEAWNELDQAAWRLLDRTASDAALADRARLFAARAEIALRNFDGARRQLDLVSTGPAVDPQRIVTLWLRRAELARAQRRRTEERFALLTLSRVAPLDPPEPLRAELGRAYERLAELQLEDGEILTASDSLSHALRCSVARAATLEPRWHEVGRKASALAAGLPNSYGLYLRTLWALQGGRPEAAADDARLLLQAQPGLGPALELAAQAALALHDHPRTIATSLELLERGWPPEQASARLRLAPRQYLLPQDRVRWITLDPRGSLAAIVERLLARGDAAGAARAARNARPSQQPPEVLPLLARTLYAAGDAPGAVAALVELPPDGPELRRVAGLALRAALAAPAGADGVDPLEVLLARVLDSGPPEDPELVGALQALLAAGRLEPAARLAAWLADERRPFLAEALLARATLDALVGTTPSESLERAAALSEDGRVELGRLVLASVAGTGLAAEARAALASPLAADPGRELALLLLAGEGERAARRIAEARLDGRATTFELAAAAAAVLAPEALAAQGAPPVTAPEALAAGLAPERYLLYVLAAELPPWSAWVRAASAEAPGASDAHVAAARALAALALGRPDEAGAELAPLAESPAPRLAWLHARVRRAAGAPEESVRAEELRWLELSGRVEDEDSELARLRAAHAARRGDRDEAVRILEQARADGGGGSALTEDLARLEDVPGRRVRAIELYGELLAGAPATSDDARVPALLAALRAAREEGEISELRWWAEVEALEAERPSDPAPARELAARAFEQPGGLGEHGRAHALARLERFRARTLERPVESLRSGEALRWTRLLARFTPEGAVRFADEELRRDPVDPELWFASAEALVAAGHVRAAADRLEALSQVAPAVDSTRLLVRLRYGLDRDASTFRRRLAALRRIEPEAERDPVLLFLAYVSGVDGSETSLKDAHELWKARATNGLAEPVFGRLLAFALWARNARPTAAKLLEESVADARSSLEHEVLLALARLVLEAGPAHQITPLPPASARNAGARPARAKGAAAEGQAAPGEPRKGPKKRAKDAAAE